jgi:hypothetical protein
MEAIAATTAIVAITATTAIVAITETAATAARAFALAVAIVLIGATSASAASRYAGTYTTTRPGVDSTQSLTLILAANGRASMTTSFPDLEQRGGPAPLPVREDGTWADRGAIVHVHFTTGSLLQNGVVLRSRKHENVIDFALQRCRLTAVRYSKLLYGEAGLTFERAGCAR